MDSRSDSLAVLLKRLGIFDDYFAWCLQVRPSHADKLEWLEKHGARASDGSVHRLHRSPEASEWRTAEAARARAALSEMLPTDMNLQIRRSLLDQRFNAVLGDLSHAELMDHYAVEQGTMEMELKRRTVALKEEQLKLSREKFEVECCEKLLELVGDAKAREIAESTSTNAEKIAQLRQLYFADVDAMEKSGAVQLPE